MKLVAIWKVPAQFTGLFFDFMKVQGIRRDSPATFLNTLCGYNFFYETQESYGDISEETAVRLAENNSMNISLYD